MSDAGLAQRLALAGVVTTVDAVNGLATLARQPESVKQVAVADRLMLTKTDLVGSGEADGLAARLAALNPGGHGADGVLRRRRSGAPVRHGARRLREQASRPAGLARPRCARSRARTHDRSAHDAEISCFAILREAPIRAVDADAAAGDPGRALRRRSPAPQGLVNVAESPDRPAVIHGVQHVFHPPAWLERWPSADRRSRLVFIGRDIPQAWVEALLEALEAEVGEVATRLTPAALCAYATGIARSGCAGQELQARWGPWRTSARERSPLPPA